MKIADTAVLVTGANRGLGRALVEKAWPSAHLCAAAGNRVGEPQHPYRRSTRRDER